MLSVPWSSPVPMTLRFLPTLLGVALLLSLTPVAAQDALPDSAATEAEAPDLAATLAADGRFTTLLNALSETGLDVDLAAGGTYTVFAPTDSAFAALPEGALEALSADDLRTVLLYHVVEGDLDVEALSLGEPVATVAGPTLDIAPLDGGVVVNGVAPTGAGAPVSNGRIYALGTVLLPPTPETAEDDF